MNITDVTDEDLDYLYKTCRGEKLYPDELLQRYIEYKLKKMKSEYKGGKSAYKNFLQRYFNASPHDIIQDFPSLRHNFYSRLEQDKERFDPIVRQHASATRFAYIEGPVEPGNQERSSKRNISSTESRRPPHPSRIPGNIPVRAKEERERQISKSQVYPPEVPGNSSQQRNKVVHVLSWYEWENGLLTISGALADLIAVPSAQSEMLIDLYIPQNSAIHYVLKIERDIETGIPFVMAQDLQVFFHRYLIAGAKIELARVSYDNRYRLRYFTVAPRRLTVLVYYDGRPMLQQQEIRCEVDEGKVLAESRYSDLRALRRIDTTDRRMAERVLWDVFERVGKIDDRGRWIAEKQELIRAVMQEKPYSEEYLDQILSGGPRWPYFYELRPGRYARVDNPIGFSIPQIADLPESTSSDFATVIEPREKEFEISLVSDPIPNAPLPIRELGENQPVEAMFPSQRTLLLVGGILLIVVMLTIGLILNLAPQALISFEFPNIP